MNKLLTAALAAAAGWAAAAGPVRPPAGAGQFYPPKARDIRALVDRELAAAMPEKLSAGAKLVAVLVPHAGLEYSGPVAARAFALVKKGDFDEVIVVATSHYKELEGAALYPGAYGTPEGAMPYDETLAKRLLAGSPLIKANASAHKKETSIEVEVPFLRRALGPVPLVGLLMNTQDLETSRQIGRAIAKASAGRRVLLVASSDQSHYPSGGVADAVDGTTLLSLRSMDPAYFWLTNRLLLNRGIPNLAVTYCGEGAVMAVMEAARAAGADGARVLGRLNSGDVVSERDYNHVVGYAAVAFLKGGAAQPDPLTLSPAQKKRLLVAAREVLAAGCRAANVPLSSDAVFDLPAAVAVRLRAADGSLRGESAAARPEESLLEEVVRRTAAAAAGPKPVSADEAARLKIELTVRGPSKPPTSAGQTFSE